MSCWRGVSPKVIWNDITKQECLICIDILIHNDPDAWKKFMDSYNPLIWSFVNQRVPSGNKEDVVQDIYLKVWKYAINWCKKIKKELFSFSRFLTRIILSCIVDDLKKKMKRQEVPYDPSILETSSEESEIIDLLFSLDEEERLLVILHYIEGATFPDMVIMSGKSEQELKTIDKRAMRKLRKELS